MSKIFSSVLLVIGIVLMVFSVTYDTAVRTDSQYISSEISVPLMTVTNLGKIEEKRTMMFIAALLIVCGVLGLLLGKPAVAKTQEDNSLYDGEPNVEVGAYQLYLTRRFHIVRNDTLQQYVIGGDLFATLALALAHADAMYKAHISIEGDACNARAAMMRKHGITLADGMYSVGGYDFDTFDQAILHARSTHTAPN